jgi:hypothetical protein
MILKQIISANLILSLLKKHTGIKSIIYQEKSTLKVAFFYINGYKHGETIKGRREENISGKHEKR